MQKSLFVNSLSTKVCKITKICDLAFTFTDLLETGNSFAQMHLVLEIKSVWHNHEQNEQSREIQ